MHRYLDDRYENERRKKWEEVLISRIVRLQQNTLHIYIILKRVFKKENTLEWLPVSFLASILLLLPQYLLVSHCLREMSGAGKYSEVQAQGGLGCVARLSPSQQQQQQQRMSSPAISRWVRRSRTESSLACSSSLVVLSWELTQQNYLDLSDVYSSLVIIQWVPLCLLRSLHWRHTIQHVNAWWTR